MELVKSTGEALSKIAAHLVDINDHIESIATAAREQATGLQEVNVAVSQMDQVTQQNAAMVEETNAVTHRLAGDADRLSHLVMRFTTSTPVRQIGKPSLAVVDGNPATSGSGWPARAMLTPVKQAFGSRIAASGD